MESVTDFKKGIKILEPFLKQHGFELHNYENTEDWSNLFTIATYKNGRKEFIVRHLPLIGQVFYQFDKSKLFHNFYLNQLGFADQNKFINHRRGENLTSFTDILYDFEFLIDDFFKGECTKLQEFSKIHDKILTEYNTKAHEEFSVHFDKLKIKTAKQAYLKKEFKKCLGIYKQVENRHLMNDIDEKIIAYCNKYMR
ncbi:MAG TPA: hypothetical protein VF411_00455 [Bacteroidia bacterium]